MQPPSPPDEHYLWLGRVTAAYAMLDVQIGMLAHTAETGERWTDEWESVSGRPGQAVALCKAALPKMPEEIRLAVGSLLDSVSTLRQERHRLTHAVFVWDPAPDEAGAPWRLRDPRGGEFPPLVASQGAHLVAAFNGLSRRAAELRAALASEVR